MEAKAMDRKPKSDSEPCLAELLDWAETKLVMQSDGIARAELERTIADARRRMEARQEP
jgi:hypothetical protein